VRLVSHSGIGLAGPGGFWDGGHVTPVLFGLLFAIGLALVVIGVVAYPHLRAGSPLLTPEGDRLVRWVGREVREKVQILAGGTAARTGSKIPGPSGPCPPDGQRAGGQRTGGSGMPPPPGTGSSMRPHDGPNPGAGSPGAGSAPGISGTRVVWASPPPQLRFDPSLPPSRSGVPDRDGGSPAAPTSR
jgi:hypothetical protein